MAIVFVLGAIPTWYNWTQFTAPALTHQPPHQAPLLVLLIALVVAILLGVIGALWSGRRHRTSSRTPGPGIVGAAVLLSAVLWFALLLPEVDSGIAAVPAVFPIAGALVVASAAGLLLRRWAGAPGWTDRHRLAVVIGALTASMAAGFLANQFGAVDLTVKAGLDIAALAGLAVLYRFFTVVAKP